jgi:hypothetical protein
MTAIPRAIPSDTHHLIEAAIAQGWTLEKRKKARHPHRLVSPDGTRMVPVKASGNQWRGVQNFRRQLRAAGVDC